MNEEWKRKYKAEKDVFRKQIQEKYKPKCEIFNFMELDIVEQIDIIYLLKVILENGSISEEELFNGCEISSDMFKYRTDVFSRCNHAEGYEFLRKLMRLNLIYISSAEDKSFLDFRDISEILSYHRYQFRLHVYFPAEIRQSILNGTYFLCYGNAEDIMQYYKAGIINACLDLLLPDLENLKLENIENEIQKSIPFLKELLNSNSYMRVYKISSNVQQKLKYGNISKKRKLSGCLLLSLLQETSNSKRLHTGIISTYTMDKFVSDFHYEIFNNKNYYPLAHETFNLETLLMIRNKILNDL